VKARPEDQRELLVLQDLDNQLTQLRHTLTHLPERSEKEALTSQMKDFSQSLVSVQGELEDAQRELSRLEDDVRVVDERIALDRQRESSSTSAKDVQALEAELASLAIRKSALEDNELELMQVVEDKQKAVNEVLSGRKDLQDQIDALATQIQAQESQLSATVDEVSKSREHLVSRLPQDLVELYERQRERYGIGAALLSRKISGGSGVELTATDLDKIRLSAVDDVVLCPDSSCILVRTTESGL
jgi:predicted  nucleic acid-binding Zn-ribbon protein